MVTVIRSAVIVPGKTGEALAFAHQIAKLITDKHGVKIDLLLPVGGNPSRIAWKSHYEGLGEWEAFGNKLLADAEYIAALATTSSIFVPGSLNDDIWRSI
jgi:hypothetical protein